MDRSSLMWTHAGGKFATAHPGAPQVHAGQGHIFQQVRKAIQGSSGATAMRDDVPNVATFLALEFSRTCSAS